jgi:hypothetical protein
MARKLWEKLIVENSVLIGEIKTLADKMQKVANNAPDGGAAWLRLNYEKSLCIDDLAREVNVAYSASLPASKRQGKAAFWAAVNKIVNG